MVQVEAKNLHMHCSTSNHESWNTLLAPIVLSINEDLDGHDNNEGNDNMAITTWKHFADMGEYTCISVIILSKHLGKIISFLRLTHVSSIIFQWIP